MPHVQLTVALLRHVQASVWMPSDCKYFCSKECIQKFNAAELAKYNEIRDRHEQVHVSCLEEMMQYLEDASVAETVFPVAKLPPDIAELNFQCFPEELLQQHAEEKTEEFRAVVDQEAHLPPDKDRRAVEQNPDKDKDISAVMVNRAVQESRLDADEDEECDPAGDEKEPSVNPVERSMLNVHVPRSLLSTPPPFHSTSATLAFPPCAPPFVLLAPPHSFCSSAHVV